MLSSALQPVKLPWAWLKDAILDNKHNANESNQTNSQQSQDTEVQRRPVTPVPGASTLASGYGQKYNDQRLCMLFSRLPAEIRLMIWKECLVGRVHVYWVRGRMYGTKCALEGFGLCWQDCGMETPCKNKIAEHVRSIAHEGKTRINHLSPKRMLHYQNKSKPGKQLGKIALLLTCRKIYSEGIGLLYSATSFNPASNALCLINLPKLILPRRMHQITNIQFYWDCYGKSLNLEEGATPNPFTQRWLTTWDIFAEMKALKILWVHFSVHAYQYDKLWLDREQLVLDSLEKIRHKDLKKFLVTGLPYGDFTCFKLDLDAQVAYFAGSLGVR